MIDNIAILGTGKMALSIARALSDHVQKILFVGRSKKSLEIILKKFELKTNKNNMAYGHTFDDLEFIDLSEFNLLIESLIEDINIKRKILSRCLTLFPETSIFSTNTSSFSGRDFGNIGCKSNLIGLHFFYPVQKIRFVELSKYSSTKEDDYIKLCNFLSKAEFEHFDVPNINGYIVNRILFSMIREARFLCDEFGVSKEIINKSITKILNHPMGPLEIEELIGMDTSERISKSIYKKQGNFSEDIRNL